MDTKVAAQVARQMATFFKVFKDVEDVLDAATRVENLKGELDGQIKSLQAQKEAAAEELKNAKAHVAKAKADYASAKARQEEEAQERLESLNRDLRQRQEAAEEALAVTRRDLEAARKTHSEFVATASAEREELEKAVKALQKQLDGLKAKVANL